MNLPQCQHRGDQSQDSFACRSNRLIHGGRVHALVCVACRYADRENIDLDALRAQYSTASQAGPGSELKGLLSRLGLKTDKSCECDQYADQMDRWGVEGCRQRRAEIVEHLRQQRDKAGWGAVLTAAGRAAAQGLRVDILDPLGWLVDEACRRAQSGVHHGG